MAQVTLKIKLEDDASKNLTKIRDELNKLDDASKPASDGMFKFKDSLVMGAVMGVAQAGIRKLGSMMKNSISSITSASDALRGYDYSMKFIGLNDKRIAESKKVLEDYAYSTVYSIKDVLNVSQVLASSGSKNFDTVATSLGNVVALGGGAGAEFKSVADALGKAGVQGKMTAQNWSAFATSIPASASMIEKELKNMGVYTGDFASAMSSGKIGINDFNQALINLGDTDFAKEFAQSSNFFVGAKMKIQNSIEKLGVDLLKAIDPNTITSFMNIIGDTIESFGEVLKTVVEYVVANKDWLLPLIASSAGLITAFLAIGKVVTVFSGAFAGLTKVIMPLISGIKLLFGLIMANPLVALITGIMLVIFWIVNLYKTNEDFRNKVNAIFQAIADFFVNIWQGIADFFVNIWQGIADFFINLWNGITSAFQGIWEGIKIFFVSIWENLKTIVSNAIDFWRTLFETVTNFFATPFRNAFAIVSGIFNNLKTITSNTVNTIKSVFSRIVSAITTPIRDAVNTAKGILKTLTDAVKTVIDGVGSGISGMFTQAVESIKGIINSYMISPLNSAIGIINNIPKVNIPTIPMLATGGIVNDATLAIIGEAGREAVVPMTNKSVMTELANEINKYRGVSVPSNSGSTNNNTNNEYIFNVTTQNFDEKSIRRFLLKEAKGCGY